MADRKPRYTQIANQAVDFFPVTPSDVTVFDPPVLLKCKGNAGDVVVKTVRGNIRTYPISTDEYLIVLVTQVRAATTATAIWALEMQ